MRLDRFDLNLLVVLDALLEERNVTRASERLHIGQSATSAALRRLRDFFGDELLVPAGRRFELTPLAEGLVGPVRDALLRSRAAISLRPTFDPATETRRFSICVSDYAISVFVGAAVEKIASKAPGIRLDFRRPPGHLHEAFERGNFDLLIIPEQYANQFDHPQALLLTDDHACLVCDDNPLVGKTLTMDDYLDVGHVAVRLGDESSLAFEEWFLPRFGRQRRIECSVDHFSAVPHVLMKTNRIATLHRRFAEPLTQQLPLSLLPAPFEMKPLVEVMVWPRYRDHDPAHGWLRSEIKKAASEARGTNPK
ncbi:LysR family transcriptional regulator [Rhizobium sp. L1K21]|uniref:LysR family transcriptional regulator n=1 Tax=Rhizobium sp. L1K21 TaxID=2954933 RepID=UPI002093E072|nr:LysR family transcriptional regulator [Rhizobium sp. L1K21]MCO6188451.1 LysR family transcriptional regulator [Rhizobium sp. L1K21]